MPDRVIDGGCITVYVRDLARARAFYVDTLGLPVRLDVPGRWLEVDGGRGLRIALRPRALEAPRAAAATGEGAGPAGLAIGFGVAPGLDDAVARLSRRGVAFEDDVRDDPEEPVRLAFFRDPDGNRLYLWEVRPTPRG